MLDISWMRIATRFREYEAINRELALFNPELSEKRQIIVINKIDLPEVREICRRSAPGSRNAA